MVSLPAAEEMKSLLLEGLRWPIKFAMKEMTLILSSAAIRPILIWMAVRFALLCIACVLFHPILAAISRPSLLKYLGMTFGSIKLSPVKLKLTITDLELLPSKSSTLASIILSLFPSANVKRVANYIDYPESRVTVGEFAIKMRVGSMGGPNFDGDPCTVSSSHPHDGIIRKGDESKDSATKRGLKRLYHFIPRRLYHFIPRPVVVVKLNDVSIEVEKAYLAPEPPSGFRKASAENDQKVPAALPPLGNKEDLPTFHQESFLESIENEETVEAEKVTMFVERWIDHAKTKMKKKGDMGISLVKSFSFNKSAYNEESEGDPTVDEETSPEQLTYDEKMNAWIHWVVELVLHLISFELVNASVTISGAGSEIVKRTREPCSPREANLAFARLPRHRRALTVVGTDAISVSFSPDAECNALFCLVGLHVKVGNPILADQADDDAPVQGLTADITYAWHTVTHPFHLVAELKGVLPFLIWSVNYDHQWPSKCLGLSLSSPEIAVSLSPDHIHTVFLHLDDYTDTLSSYNEWLDWLKDTHCQKNLSSLSDDEKLTYRENYAKSKGATKELDKNEKQMTISQMKVFEKRMTCYEIMDLRCFSMRDLWRIPKGNEELMGFLQTSRSSIREKGNENHHATSVDTSSPFQRVYATPHHALVALIRENSSLLAPHVTVNCIVQTLHIDFCHDDFGLRDKSSTPLIPSSITVSKVSLGIDQSNILSLDTEGLSRVDDPRPFLELSLSLCSVKWDVTDPTSSLHEELPLFRDRSPVGVVYMSEEHVSTKPVLSLDLTIAVAPTIGLDQHFDLTFKTSDLVILINPLPLLSAVKILIELSDFPVQCPDEMLSDLNENKANQDTASEASSTPLGIQASIIVCVENTELLFLVDRKKVPRGILTLTVYQINTELVTGGLSGKLSVLAEPVVLMAGQICQNQSSHDRKIDTILMPFQPIADVDGAKLLVTGKEDNAQHKKGVEARTTLALHVDVGTESVFFNASPSTIVAMFGVVSSLDPFINWLQGEDNTREEDRMKLESQMSSESERHVRFQRQVLVRIFKEVDVDCSGELSEDELERVVLKLFDENTGNKGGETKKINSSERPTESEVQRERDYLLSIMDPGRSNEITFQELDSSFFRLANEINDINLIPKVQDTKDRLYYAHFKNSDSFLSGPWLRKLVYFDDLKEYSSSCEVFRITGKEGLENCSFPMPSMWRRNGMELFWDFYTRETGCQRHSLNGQTVKMVQRKLVRSLSNYQFAKFCWKTLVQPELYAASDGDEGKADTHWLLDKDSRSLIKSGVIERLLQHVQTEVIKEINARGSMSDIHYDLRLNGAVGNVILRFGSSHTFANPLFEARFSEISCKSSALISSQTLWFVPEKESTNLEDEDRDENHGGNTFSFQSTIGADYLNTKHNHMECFVEPYPCFGSILFVSKQDSSGDDEAASTSVHLNCPRFLNMNTSRSFFETASVLTKVFAQSDPTIFRNMIFDRDVAYIRSFWDERDQRKSGFLSRNEALEVLHSATSMHWKDEIAGLTPNEKHHFLLTFCNLADQEGDGIISFANLVSALRIFSSRSYFSGSKEILLKNNVGREVKASTKDNLDNRLTQYSITSDYDYEHLFDTFLSIEDGNSGAVPLVGKLCLFTPGYKIIDDISVSPYQTLMFPLKYKKKGSRRRRHARASGFSPYLTLVPKSDSLDSISLDIRTSLSVRTDIPIKIRIVRIGKLAGKFRKKGAKKTKLDLSKKTLMPALRRVVEGAPIVYEKSVTEGGVAPLPLDVLDSSHYHALLIEWNSSWRDPVLLTKDFLFNPTNIREVSRCHALSGIVVRKERLNVHLSDTHRNTLIASDTKRSILRRTAWDTTIQVVPFFLISNSLPFPIVVRTWQTAEENEDELWDEPLIPDASHNDMFENSSDEDLSVMTPSIKGRRALPEDIHFSGGGNFGHYSEDQVAMGQTLSLSGASLRENIFMQISQHVNASREVKFMWTNPIRVDLPKLKTGINQKGVSQLPKLILDLGDHCDCLVDVTVKSDIKVPLCTIYSPYWIINKTGSKLEYRISGRDKVYLDSGNGGLPVMIHGSKSEHTNEKYKNISREISIIPLESPSQALLHEWWDETSNGSLVLKKGMMEEKGHSLADWSENIQLDAVGTNGEIYCKHYILNVSIDSLAGAFHRSNLISFTPRYVVKNMLHITVSILPLFGGVHDALRKASQLRQNLKEDDKKRKLDLAPGESTAVFNFHNVSRGMEKPYHWLAFCVNAARFGASFKSKWHLIPVDVIDSHFFGEHDGCADTMVGILEAKVHSVDTGSMLVSISHANNAPFRIENRSTTHYLRFIQDDAEAVVFELPPMFSCGYCWDSPLGKKSLRAVAIPTAKSRESELEEALKLERNGDMFNGKERNSDEGDETLITADSDEESIESGRTNESTNDPLLYSLRKGAKPVDARQLNKTARYRSPRKNVVFSRHSRSYRMTEVGRQKDLPCPSAQECGNGQNMMSSNLFTHTRILGGTKILSFSDSTWLADQVQAGFLRKGGDFKRALIDVNVEGFGLYMMDDYPKEIMAIVIRDIQLQKQRGSIETSTRVRHFQVDAMLENARYPIIIQPLPLGVDRRESTSVDLIVPENVDKRECYWMKNEEKPVPVFELAASYVPQVNMIWVPSINIFVCPLKLQIDVEYILRILGVVINAFFKYQDDTTINLSATSNANDQLTYTTRGQMNICMTYIENLYIAPVYFDIELNIKSDDPDQDEGGDSGLTLHSIAQSTSSAAVAGVLSWLINVGANFAHVSPCFRYSQVTYTDQYCDIIDLLKDIAISYFVDSIKQSYKVVLSMQLLGDPSYLIHQYKTGMTDLFKITRNEIAAGGKDGVGKGVTSLVQNVAGGTFFAAGKVAGGWADTVDSVTKSEMTSNHLKPKSASSDGRHPDNAVDGVVQGTKYLGQAVAHGVAGLIGNPYRGAKTGTVTGVAKGVASGVTGLVAAPLVGALGFIAKTADGAGATTNNLDKVVIEARCRPARTVPWGRPMSPNGLSYLKAIGICVHTVRYQKIRRRIVQKDDADCNEVDGVTSKEYKRIRAAEERRKNPPRKLVSIMHEKDKYHYITAPIRPKLLSDAPGNLVLSHYAVTFEETLIIRSTDLQLGDVVSINFWNHNGLKSATTRAKPLGQCKLSIGDIYTSALHLYQEQLRRKESNLLTGDAVTDSLIVPVPQECALFRLVKKAKPAYRDIFDAIGEEMAAIEKSEEDKFAVFDSDSSESDSDTSFLDDGGKAKDEDPASLVKANERLFGSVSLSFFPIPW